MAAVHEIVEWLASRGFRDDGCSVYGCEDTTYAVLRVGGGPSPKETSTSTLKFCEAHFSETVADGIRFMRNGVGR